MSTVGSLQRVVVAILVSLIVWAVANITLAQRPQAGTGGLGDSYFPTLGNGGYDVQHYHIDITVDVDANAIDVTETINAVATLDLRAFNLDFLGFTIHTLKVNGKSASFARDGRELTITPLDWLQTDQEFTVTIDYSGVPGADVEDAIFSELFSLGWNHYGDGIYVASEPSGASRWYAVNDHPSDKATYSFHITVADNYIAAANGVLQEVIVGEGENTYVWVARDPIASYLVTIHIGKFVRQEEQLASGVLLRNYFPVEAVDRGSRTFRQQGEMLDYFESILGEYPFEVYGVAVADTLLPFALETQTLSTFGTSILVSQILAERVIVHELAHQWFGNSVTPTQWQDIWLNEGFATYAEFLWTEHTDGVSVLDERIEVAYEFSKLLPGISDGTTGDPGKNNLFNPRLIYIRGALTLHALRLHVGDDAFFDTLRLYVSRFQYDNATTQDFIDVAEEVSRMDLDEFFDSWLHSTELPAIPAMGLYGN